MAEMPNPPDLGETLRPALEQLRRQPIPADAVARAVDRARRLRQSRAGLWRGPRRHHLAVAAAAAVLFLGVGLVPTRGPDGGSLLVDRVTNNKDLTNADPNESDRVQLDYNLDRIAGVTVPGAIDPRAPIGIVNSPEPADQRVAEGVIRIVGQDRTRFHAAPQSQLDQGPGGRQNVRLSARGWGELPALERAKRFGEFTDRLPREGRKAVEDYFKQLLDQPSKPGVRPADARLAAGRVREAEESLRRMERVRIMARGSISEYDYNAAKLALSKYREELAVLEFRAAGNEPAARQAARRVAELHREQAKRRLDLLKQFNSRAKGAISAGDLRAAERELEEATRAASEPAPPPSPPAPKGPVVWHRDAARPSFARVYVGNGVALELVSLHVRVTLDGPRARTLVDHVFRNPHDRRLEGTFEYPLPAGASPSYFAMFAGGTRDAMPALARPGTGTVPPLAALANPEPAQLARGVEVADWGKLQEARVVPNQKAAEAYEDVVRQRIDPALMEYAGGNTFRGRVFPIAPRGYNRVLLAYEETLPVSDGNVVYRFPLPTAKIADLDVSLWADRAADASFQPAGAEKVEQDGKVVFHRAWKDEAPGGDVLFRATPPRAAVQAVSGRAGGKGPHYLYARVRPDLPVAERAAPFARHAVFLLDTSGSEGRDRFAVSLRLLQAILEGDGDLESFNVLAFNAGAAWVEPKGMLPNTKEGRAKLHAALDGLLLEGATDLGAALDKLCAADSPVKKGAPTACFLLSDGNLTWGETDVPALLARFKARCPFPARWHCYRTGLGEENAELFDGLTRDGGAVFQVFGEAELAAAASAHRRQCLTLDRVHFEGGPAASDLLVAGRRSAVYPGGELLLGARFAGAGATRAVLEGTFNGKRFTQSVAVEVGDGGELAPRAWGELAVASLLALGDPRLESLAAAYCQEFGIAGKAASLLVLENEADYRRLNLDEERGRALKGDLAAFLHDAWAGLTRELSPKDAFARLLDRVDASTKILSGPEGGHVRELLSLMGDDEFRLPDGAVGGALTRERDADRGYLTERERDPGGVAAFLNEAVRRSRAGDADGAVRALSGVVELYPARGDALRLVGYRLLDLGQAAHAARLFDRVRRSRPFEPHSYRDLARSLEECGRYGLAAVQYEAVLAGTWHNRFGADLQRVVREEYAAMMRQAVRAKAVTGPLADHFGERLERLRHDVTPADLRVTISWNTDATDVDLWVIEPDGTKVFYSAPHSKSGGTLSQDMTRGYGPERYQIVKAGGGEYRVVVHYYAANANLIGGETHVNVVVTRDAGRPGERSTRQTVVLKQPKEEVTVARVKF